MHCLSRYAYPIHQFEIHPIVKLGQVGGHEIALLPIRRCTGDHRGWIAALLVAASSSRAWCPGAAIGGRAIRQQPKSAVVIGSPQLAFAALTISRAELSQSVSIP